MSEEERKDTFLRNKYGDYHEWVKVFGFFMLIFLCIGVVTGFVVSITAIGDYFEVQAFNRIHETDYTFGFNTAITRATEAIQNLHTTAKSHHRTIIIEVMGRHAGWMTLEAGIGGGASIILLPEEPFDIEEVCKIIKSRKNKGKNYECFKIFNLSFPDKPSTQLRMIIASNFLFNSVL